MPYCWNKLNTSTNSSYNYYPYAYSSYARTGSRSLYFYSSTYSAYGDAYAVLPEMNVNSVRTLQLKLYARKYSTSYSSNLEVGVMTDRTDVSTFVKVADVQPTTTSYEEFVVRFDDYTGQGKFIAMRALKPNSSSNYVYVDDITVELLPTCAEPNSLAYAKDTLSWQPGTIGHPINYNVQYRLIGETEWTTATTDTNFFVLSGLLPGADYQAQVQSQCDSNDFSGWSNELSFSTECVVLTANDLPYHQGFESASCPAACWSLYYGSTGSSTATINQMTHVTDAHAEGGRSFRFSSFSSASDYYEYLISPELNAGNDLIVSFQHAKYSNSYADQMWFGYSTTDNNVNSFVWAEVDLSESWNASEAVIPANAKYIAFKYYGECLYYVYLDDVNIQLVPTCYAPTNVVVSNVTYNSAKVSWSDNKNQKTYTVEYMAEGDTAWTTLAGDSTMSTALSGLTYSTNYIARVKVLCPATNEEEYSEEVEFTTTCMGFGTRVEMLNVPTEITNSNTSTSDYIPTYGNYNYSYTQQIFKASELDAPNGGTISAISFEVSNGGSRARNLDIYLMHTSQNAISSWLPFNNAVRVYSGVVSFSEVGWKDLEFSTPFQYNGEDNLVLIVDDNTGGWNNYPTFRTHTTNFNCSRYAYNDDYNYSPSNPSSVVTGTATTTTSRNNVKFAVTKLTPSCPLDYDLAVDSIAPIADACDLSDAKVTVRVKNNSFLNAVNGFTATIALNDTADVVTETVNATIPAQGTYIYTFTHVPAYTDGANSIKVTVTAANDEDATNDVITLNDVYQVVPATVPYEQNFNNVVLGKMAWTQGVENNNPNRWTNNNGVLTFMDNDTIDAQNYVITHCIEIPEGQFQISYDYNALSNLTENMNVYMGTTQDISEMTLIGSHDNFTKAADDYTYNCLLLRS